MADDAKAKAAEVTKVDLKQALKAPNEEMFKKTWFCAFCICSGCGCFKPESPYPFKGKGEGKCCCIANKFECELVPIYNENGLCMSDQTCCCVHQQMQMPPLGRGPKLALLNIDILASAKAKAPKQLGMNSA